MKALFFRLRQSAAGFFGGLLLRLGAAYLRLFPWDRLSTRFKDLETHLRRRGDQSRRLQKLLDRPLRYLDVGARGGLSGFLLHYRPFLECHLVEPEPAEAARLRAAGYQVIEEALAADSGTATLHVTRKPGLSGLLEPGGDFLDYYRGGSDRFEVLKRLPLKTTTIESVCDRAGKDFDLLKIDTQGSELDVLRGLGRRSPLFILTEISFLDLYRDQATFPELARFLEDKGYLLWDLLLQPQPAPGKRRGLRQDGLPLHGDAGFMPNWKIPAGWALIERSPKTWAALMIIYGLEDVLHYILDTENLPQADFIRAALKEPVGRLPLPLYSPVLY